MAGGGARDLDVPLRVLNVSGRTLDAQVAATQCVMRFELAHYLTAAQAAVRNATTTEPVACTVRVTGFDAASKKVTCSELFFATPRAPTPPPAPTLPREAMD